MAHQATYSHQTTRTFTLGRFEFTNHKYVANTVEDDEELQKMIADLNETYPSLVSAIIRIPAEADLSEALQAAQAEIQALRAASRDAGAEILGESMTDVAGKAGTVAADSIKTHLAAAAQTSVRGAVATSVIPDKPLNT